MTISRFFPAFLIAALCAMPAPLRAEDPAPDVTATILQRDALFWKSYNDCAVGDMGAFLTTDVEFYHDKGGITLGATALVESVRKNLCSKPDFRIRRAAVEGTVHVFALKNGDAVYGAVIAGEHLFYIRDKDKPEFADGHARFTHLWLLKDGEWRMARILSFDHGPAAAAKVR